MFESLEGQVAVVTGSGRGIGEGVACALARAGAQVVISDILADRCDVVVERIKTEGGQAAAHPADLSTTAANEALIRWTVEQFGRIDILVNNAGFLILGGMLEVDEEQVDKLIAVNFKSMWAASREALRHMKQQKYGRIVNVASNAAKRGNIECGMYSATKAAIIALTKSNAAEFGPDGITVNAICPTAWTEMERWASGGKPKPTTHACPVGRIGDVDADIAPAVLFLCSKEAGYVTAQILGVDGGMYR